MSETYAAGRPEQREAGGFIIAVISAVSALLVIGGLAYAAGTGARHQAALAAGECEPNLSHSGEPCTTVQMLVSQYAQLAAPATQQLDTDAAAYSDSDFSSRAAARSALQAEVTLETSFGSSLARFPFPPAAIPAATALMKANQAVVALTAQQAQSATLLQMRSFNSRVRVARDAVQTDMAQLARVLQTPPTASQEP